MQCVRNCDSPDPSLRKNFEQPVYQTAQMFVGEMGCWLVVGASSLVSLLKRRLSSSSSAKSHGSYAPLPTNTSDPSDDDDDDALQPATDPAAKPLTTNEPDRRPLRGWRVILLALPAACDLTGTTLMNVGLLFVAASIYQMTRGALVLFVGLFSVLFLRHRLAPFKWLALVIVVAGVAVVGLAGAIEQRDATVPGSRPQQSAHSGVVIDAATSAFTETKRQVVAAAASTTEATPAARTVAGVLLIALAQVFTAAQFVVEEAIMRRYSLTPLGVVGWEGTFGLLLTLLAQAVLHAAYGRTDGGRGGFFDARQGWGEMVSSRAVVVSSVLIMVSIGGFNYFGLSVTRSVSATSRSTIDTCRTLFIWVVSLGLGWETFKWLQVVGFAGLVYGTFLFNELVRPPRWGGWFWGRRGKGHERRGEELLGERPIEHS